MSKRRLYDDPYAYDIPYTYIPRYIPRHRMGNFHSAEVAIFIDPSVAQDSSESTRLLHSDAEKTSCVLFRSYKDGIRVGRTYVSNEAIEHIYKKHKDFLHSKDCVEHQSGVE